MALIEVTEYTDYVCSSAWGMEPYFRRLEWRFGPHLKWRKVMGGLVGDVSEGREGWTRVSGAEPMRAYWRRVWKITCMPYPNPMHIMMESTDDGGRAVKAAELQGQEIAAAVLRRLREQVFIFGIGPQTPDEFVEAAKGIPGLDMDRWRTDMASPEVAAAFRADWEETRRPNEFIRNLKQEGPMNGEMKHSEGHDRYSLPTFIFRGPGGEHTVAGYIPYEHYEEALKNALPESARTPRPDPTPEQALSHWGCLTAKELEFLCGEGSVPPVDAVTHDWGDGLVYFSPKEAAARGIGVKAASGRPNQSQPDLPTSA